MADYQKVAERLSKGIETLITNAKGDIRFYEGAMEGIREFTKALEAEEATEAKEDGTGKPQTTLSQN